MTVEEAEAGPNQLRFKLVRIGRISFSHDSAVRLVGLRFGVCNVLFRNRVCSDVPRMDPPGRATFRVTTAHDHHGHETIDGAHHRCL